MSGDNFTDGLHKTRTVLGDVTNRSVKRGFLSISGNLGLKSGKNVAGEDGDSNFAKQVGLGVENLVKQKCTTTTSNEIIEVGDSLRDSCVSGVSLPTCSKPSLKDGGEGRISSIDVTQSSNSRVCRSDDKDLGVGRLASSKFGSIEWSRLPKSQGSRSFELERCTGLKGGGGGGVVDGCANMNAGADLLKACSCSFCLKAAYIWSDLHYQDIKGRIAAIKKSQKEATFLVQKSGRGKGIDIHGQGNSNKSAKLESDLTGQWRSLFLQMEDVFVRETSQLQASFATLKDLRENCKMDLERTTGMPSDKH